MDLRFSKGKIIFDKELSNLDKFVIDFVDVLDNCKINYVIMSGYVSILFGRNRESEDIDMFIEKIDFEKFKKLWTNLQEKFECIITTDVREAYKHYLYTSHAIRFSYKNKFIPNMELKFPKSELDQWTLDNKKEVIINGKPLLISPIESQISFKIFLSSEQADKDIEDAKFLYDLFSEHLDLNLLTEFNRKLKIEDKFNKYIK